MGKAYSANNELRNLIQNVGFTLHIFDDIKNLGPEIKLRDEKKNGEIDAVIIYKNIICFVGTSKGKRDVNKEIERYFEKLDNTNSISDSVFKLEITKKQEKDIDDKIKAANDMLRSIKDHIAKKAQAHTLIFKKLFFCPHKQIDEKYLLKERNRGRIIIDKDAFDYFQEVSNRLGKPYSFYDFMHFLDIKKIDLTKKGTSRSRKPAKSSPFKNVTKLDLKRGKVVAYSISLAVEDISENITVLRMAQKYNKKGFQRMIKATRLTKINNEYLSSNQTFPNNIIFALNPEIYKKESDFYDESSNEITFFDEYNSIIVIDGQHRYFSFVKGIKCDREILGTFIFFKGGNEEDSYLLMEKMFYEINKTQEKIDPNLSFILRAKIDVNSDAYFWYEIFKKLHKTGFFTDRFSFRESTLRKSEAKKSIISVITYSGVLALNKQYKRKGLAVDGLNFFYGTDNKTNINFSFNLLKNYFDIIEKVLHDQGCSKDNLSPREIGAIIRLLRHFLLNNNNRDQVQFMGENKNITKSSLAVHKSLVKSIWKILNCIPFKKAVTLDYPASNWAAVEGYMLKKINQKHPEFGNKCLLSKKALEIYKK